MPDAPSSNPTAGGRILPPLLKKRAESGGVYSSALKMPALEIS